MTSIVSKKYIIAAVSVCFGGLVLLAVLHSFVVSPQNRTAAELENQVADKKAEYKIATETASDAAKEKMEQKLRTVCDTFDSFIVKHSGMASLALDIKQIAGEIGVEDFASTNKTINECGKISQCEQIEEGRILVEFNGSFTQFAQFVNKLERNKPVVLVDTFTVKRAEKAGSKHRFKMALVFFVKKRQISLLAEHDMFAINAGTNIVPHDFHISGVVK